jgi:hypothetical protein
VKFRPELNGALDDIHANALVIVVSLDGAGESNGSPHFLLDSARDSLFKISFVEH